jgi:hypothetical protein
MGILTVFQ